MTNDTKILPINVSNYFELFELPQSFEVNLPQLDQKLFEKLKLFHPDKFVTGTKQEKELSFENSNTINIAYKTLKSPLTRARYLLELEEIDPEKSQALDEDFLMETLEWREQLEEKESDNEINMFLEQVLSKEQEGIKSLDAFFKQKLYTEACKVYIRLKFIQRFKDEIENRLTRIG